MADIIAVDTARSNDSELVDENIKVGEPAVRKSGGGLRQLDASSDTDVDYIVLYEREGDHVLEYETDFVSYSELYTYKPASNKPDEDWDDRAVLLPLTEKDVVRALTPEDETLSEPTFTNNDVVGFINAPNGPRLVPDGYTDDFSGASTTYTESNGNFVKLGEVDVQAPFKTIRGGYGEYIGVRVTDNS